MVKPAGTSPNNGSRSDQLIHVMDLMPTFLSVAKTSYPDTFEGETIVPVQGVSFMPLLEGRVSDNANDREIGWSAYGMDAYRKGGWKALRLPMPYGNGNWQLYNLMDDPAELNDLAKNFPDRTQELAKAWDAYATRNGVIQPDSAVFYAKPVSEKKY